MKREKCADFIKIKGNWGNSGLCSYKDCRVNLGYCKKCEDYNSTKYIRKENKHVY
jgi:hypothetical protein